VNAKPLIALAALALLFVGMSGKQDAPAFQVNQAAEAEACEWVVLNKPTKWSGALQGDTPQLEWLAHVAFHRAYGRWAILGELKTNNQAELDRQAAITVCVAGKLNQPPPNPIPNPPPNLPPPPPPGVPLEFDLETNWGGMPLETREHLARIELASQIPGIARFLAVKAWQAFRANTPLVTPAQAAVIAAANPNLARNAINPNDGPKSLELINANIAQGWPVPLDKAGWAAGSFGLFDLLGGTAVYSGIHRGTTPLVNATSAAQTMKRWDAQGFAASYFVYRCLFREDLPVLSPAGGINVNGNSAIAWPNVAACWLSPEGFKNKTPAAMAARQRFIDRAAEIGIDLAAIRYPWPPGTTYTEWPAAAVWTRMQDYTDRPVVQG
jgi:hypothetical protein